MNTATSFGTINGNVVRGDELKYISMEQVQTTASVFKYIESDTKNAQSA